ncbi:MAG: translation initiation factor IF-3 [Holosporales bacterium]|jgi:translation initiation factor IF-3|nr:translation initiation factor IF-3 [Holosporales bacterium]
MSRPQQSEDSLRINQYITAKEVRLILNDGSVVGVVSRQDALDAAESARLDLVEVSPKAEPPVCKIMDYGKYRYEQQKKKNEARKKQNTVEVKEIQLRPGIDSHDLEIKVSAAEKFIKNGNKVKFSMRFRGREFSHQTIGLDVLSGVISRIGNCAKLEIPPKLEGKQYTMLLAPNVK